MNERQLRVSEFFVLHIMSLLMVQEEAWKGRKGEKGGVWGDWI